MKRTLAIILAALMLLSTAALAEPTETPPVPAINNGDFELPLGPPEEAGNARSNDGETILSIDTQDVFEGEGALKITNRQNEWGAVAFDVLPYLQAHGTGSYYATAMVKGFSGKGRLTLHTRYTDGRNVYRQTGVLHDFNAKIWTKFGVEPDGFDTPIAMKDEGEWDPILDTTDLEYAVLYFWIEGDNTADLWIDNVSFFFETEMPQSENE